VISLDYLAGLLSRMGSGAYALVFAGALLESAAMLGLLVPGEALVLLAGFFAARHVFDLDALIACVAAGAALGDTLGYEMGRLVGRPGLQKFRGRAGITEERIERVDGFFDRHGASSVFLGRFIGFARALVPFLAGASRMPYRRFLPYNLAGAALWSAAIVLAGYVVGGSWHLVEAWLGRASAVVAAGLALAWLLRRHLRKAPAGWVELALIVLAVCLFASITEDVATGDPLTKLDAAIVHWFEAHRVAALTRFLMVVSWLHAPVPMTLATVAFAAWLVWRRDWLWFKTLVAAIPFGMLVNTLVKLVVHRPRPVLQEPLLTLHSFSFPSGHVAGSTLFYGVLCAFVVAHSSRAGVRSGAPVVGLVMVLLVALSRVYLGAHFPSDVLGALAEAGAWLTLPLSIRHGHILELWRSSSLSLLAHAGRRPSSSDLHRSWRLPWILAGVALVLAGVSVLAYQFLVVMKE
jgi:undecaprenyl-diphosphatase